MSVRDHQEEPRALTLTAPRAPPQSPVFALDRLAAIASDLGATRLLVEIEAFRQRIAAGRFYVACVGEFKRGKSTLLNALMGRPVLPTGIIPVTAVPTVLQYGEEPTGLIRFASGETRRTSPMDLEAYISEARNPQNALGVEAVEVFLPHPLLRDGMCLVDTPGLGSVFQGSTAATRAFVPQIDAALVVIGVDPPLSGDELALVKEAAHHVRHLIVVLNKADRFTQAERREVIGFAEQTLSRELGRAIEPVLEISATERLAGTGPMPDWPTLLKRLGELGSKSGQALVRAAFQRGIERLAARCARALDETYAALWRPIEESERRMERMRSYASDFADRWLRLGFGMEQEEGRLTREAIARRRQFLEDALSDATSALARAIAQSPLRAAPALRRQAFRLARDIARQQLAPWLEGERAQADTQYERFLEHGVAQAHDLLARSTELAELGLRDLSLELDPIDQVRVPSRVDPDQIEPPDAPPVSPLRWCLDLIGPRRRTRRAITHEATRHLERLLRNGARLVEADLDGRLGRSRERLVHAAHDLLQGVYETIDWAVERARAVRAEGQAARNRELSRLEGLRRDLAALQSAPPL